MEWNGIIGRILRLGSEISGAYFWRPYFRGGLIEILQNLKQHCPPAKWRDENTGSIPFTAASLSLFSSKKVFASINQGMLLILMCTLSEYGSRLGSSVVAFKLSLPTCRFRVVASELSLPSCRFRVVASELSLPSCSFQVVASENSHLAVIGLGRKLKKFLELVICGC